MNNPDQLTRLLITVVELDRLHTVALQGCYIRVAQNIAVAIENVRWHIANMEAEVPSPAEAANAATPAGQGRVGGTQVAIDHAESCEKPHHGAHSASFAGVKGQP